MHLINQPINEILGSFIKSNLNGNYNKFSFIVAYAKLSGVRQLLNHINTFKSNGGQVIGTIGIDQFNTSLEAVQALFNICDELYIYHSENNTQTFHPKVYYFESNDKIWFSCGSSNMTCGGLFTNYETNIFEEIESTNDNFSNIHNDFHQLFDNYSNTSNSCCLRVTEELIANLVDNGYIYTEEHIARNGFARTHNPSSTSRLFGSERFTHPLEPHVDFVYTDDDLNNNSDDSETNPATFFEHNTNEIGPNIATYNSTYGSYENFVNLIDGFSKNYYYIPQGVHLGHIFYIVKSLGDGNLDYRLSLFNASTSGIDGTTIRQTNYKIGSCMELLLLNDYRLPNNIINNSFTLQLSQNGRILYELLNKTVTDPDFYNFSTNSDTTWRMVHNNPDFYVDFIQNMDVKSKEIFYRIFNNLTIFRLLVNYVSTHANKYPPAQPEVFPERL